MISDLYRISRIVLVGTACLLICLSRAYGVVPDSSWQLAPPAPGNWFDASNWTSGVPTSASGQNAFVDNGGTAQISSAGANWYWLKVGNSATGHLVQSSGGSAGMYLSTGFNAGSTGSITLQGGTINAGSGFDIGYYGDGTVTQTGGTISSFAATLGYYTGSGHYNQSGGLLSVDGVFVGNGIGSRADYSLSGTGQINANGSYYSSLWVGRYGTGTFDQTGGVVTTHLDVLVAEQSTASGSYKISGGTLSFGQNLRIADAGVGNFTVEGSAASISGGGLIFGNHGSLDSGINSSGVSAIKLTGSATLAGTWTVEDLGASLGRFDIIKGASISGSFVSVVLPGPGWAWGIDNGKTLWVSHVPECSSLVLAVIALGSAPALRIRRK